ncbi:hypothetical protein K3495_g7784, partial [Podosphaera aphanis]
MAPPLVPKRALPPDPQDAGNRDSKPKSTSSKNCSNSLPARSAMKSAEANRKAKAIERALSVSKLSPDAGETMNESMNESTDESMDEFQDVPSSDTTDSVCANIDFNTTDNDISSSENWDTTSTPHNSASLMDAIKGLLDLTNDYLRELENKHPSVGADFLALLADGASRAKRGQRVYAPMPNRNKSLSTGHQTKSWAERAACLNSEQKVLSLKKPTIRASPPQGQGSEDRRIMIRLGPDHEARKADSYELRQAIQKLVPDSTLVSDVWSVPSGVAILAPTPAKAATILQAKSAIENRFGNALVERQESWTTFVIGPIKKKVRCHDGQSDRLCDPLEGLLQEELATVRESVPIR